ncbi:hypothetical protein DICVIV_10600 [Dictyocaulus viviparus]|uniref:Uncharacterized protein n=1 Tax=Dictyocaulus viviparus TaxID=29172 RepID=A0A0D8XHY0_DICVI|nr:hypothetical protein DICVIV_10600 [Dictyocaulus viviparus]
MDNCEATSNKIKRRYVGCYPDDIRCFLDQIFTEITSFCSATHIEYIIDSKLSYYRTRLTVQQFVAKQLRHQSSTESTDAQIRVNTKVGKSFDIFFLAYISVGGGGREIVSNLSAYNLFFLIAKREARERANRKKGTEEKQLVFEYHFARSTVNVLVMLIHLELYWTDWRPSDSLRHHPLQIAGADRKVERLCDGAGINRCEAVKTSQEGKNS